MLTPRYLFADDFASFYPYFLSQPHVRKSFQTGDALWAPDQPLETFHYIISGVAQNYVAHENGHRKIISFHGPGTVFPGYHQQDYRIERAIVTRALSPMEVLAFTRAQFQQMFASNSALSAQVVEWFAMYVNLLLYETAHQEYNDSFLKLCNLLYLLLKNQPGGQDGSISATQEDIADILGVSRVILTRGLAQLRAAGILRTHRRRIEVIDPAALARLCSLETI